TDPHHPQRGLHVRAQGHAHMRQGRAAPLFAQVLGLVIVSLVAAHAISLIILFSLPPPPPEAYRLSQVAAALRAPGVIQTGEPRPLVTNLHDSPPHEGPVGRRRAEFRYELSRELAVSPDRVVVSTDIFGPTVIRRRGPSPSGSRLFRMRDPVIFAPF